MCVSVWMCVCEYVCMLYVNVYMSVHCVLIYKEAVNSIYVDEDVLCGSFRRAAPFVEHFIILSDKIILKQGVTYQKIK